jgi:hypothetical protein
VKFDQGAFFVPLDKLVDLLCIISWAQKPKQNKMVLMYCFGDA